VPTAALTVSFTVIACGLFDAPGAERVIVPLYEVADRPLGLTVIVSEDGAVPEGVADSHVAFEVALQLSVPLPALVMETTCVGGVVPPIA
jgi:hypothetical protein